MSTSIKFSALSFIVALFIYSCTKQPESNMPEDVNVTSTTFIEDDLLAAPMAMTATNSGLAVINNNTADSLVDLFDANGALVSRFLAKGNGPNEAVRIMQTQYYPETKSFYAVDYDKHTILEIKDAEKGKPAISTFAKFTTTENQHAIDVNATQLHLSDYMGVLADGYIVGTNGTNSGMVALFDKNLQLKDIDIPYPDKDKTNPKLTDWANINRLQPQLIVSPDGNFAVIHCYTADIRAFLIQDCDSIKYTIFEDAYPNDLYLIQSGPDFVQAAITQDSKIYSLDVSLSNNFAYQSYSGQSGEELTNSEFYKDTKCYGSTLIRVFDKEGKHVKNIHLDQPAKAIAVSPDDKTLYSLTESSQFGNRILKYEL